MLSGGCKYNKDLIMKQRSSLAVQWLGFTALTAGGWIQSLVRELGFCKQLDAVYIYICCCSIAQSCSDSLQPQWTAAQQAFLSFTISWSLLRLMSIVSVMPSNHLILCRHLLLLPSDFPSIRVFSNESVLCIRSPKYWSFSFSISPYS